jgi:hypothetical protein
MIDDLEVTEGSPDVLPEEAGTLRQVLDLAVSSVDARTSPAQRAERWRQIQAAHVARSPVGGRILLTVGAGAFMYLGSTVYGFAPRLELPNWVPRQPRRDCVGRELEGMIVAIDEDAGAVMISPRLLALRHLRAAASACELVQGSVVSSGAAGLTVDVDGVRGFVPLRELSPDALLTGPEPGSAWRGYVSSVGDTSPQLTQQPPEQRARRALQRRQALALLVPGEIATGRVIRTSSAGALVSVAEGLVWGDVPRAALRSPAGRLLNRGDLARFRIVSRDDRYPAELLLWPAGRCPSSAPPASK